jgi:hypothetical protein
MLERLTAVATVAGALCAFSLAGAQDSAPLAASQAAAPAATRTISFSGHNWTVKSSFGKVGPGPNYFSNSAS